MIYEKIKAESNLALKSGDKTRRLVLSDIIASIEKATVQKNGRAEITDSLTNDVLIKYKKTVEEMVDTCPTTEAYANRRNEYLAKLDIVKEFAPKILNNPNEIEQVLRQAWSADMIFDRTKKGDFIKYFMVFAKNEQCDMKTANAVINKMWKEYIDGE